ncbi:hypothetical protein [Spiroplasma endosymbiont of Polydrusus formosus]|uniref:hypothetical protein n=1 Tax=Spiroplasma endosymbiont of Polydrusus formosus TaxID=3139326 RepID=UPI0035B525B6
MLIDLFNREIIGYSVETNKIVQLVQETFYSIIRPLKQITLFHNNWGNEFKNKIIDNTLNIFNIKQSLSNKKAIFMIMLWMKQLTKILKHNLSRNKNL